MNEELTQEAVDAAIILENRVNDRIEKEVHRVLDRQISKLIAMEVDKAFRAYKDAMLMEISVTVGKIMRHAEEENRKPLWESTPEELGLSRADLNKHMLGKDIDENAIHKIP